MIDVQLGDIPKIDVDMSNIEVAVGEPAQYLKNATVSGNTLTLTKKDDSTVVFEPEGRTYTAGDNIQISAQNVISATDTKYTAGTNISIDADNKISADIPQAPVQSVNGKTGVVVLDADDVHALPDDTNIPTKTSDLTNDSGYITSSYHDSTKQDKLTAGSNVEINNNVISATDTTYTAGSNVQIINNQISATDTTYTAGENITIENNVISATGGSTYTAGPGIEIDSDNKICEKVPLYTDTTTEQMPNLDSGWERSGAYSNWHGNDEDYNKWANCGKNTSLPIGTFTYEYSGSTVTTTNISASWNNPSGSRTHEWGFTDSSGRSWIFGVDPQSSPISGKTGCLFIQCQSTSSYNYPSITDVIFTFEEVHKLPSKYIDLYISDSSGPKLVKQENNEHYWVYKSTDDKYVFPYIQNNAPISMGTLMWGTDKYLRTIGLNYNDDQFTVISGSFNNLGAYDTNIVSKYPVTATQTSQVYEIPEAAVNKRIWDWKQSLTAYKQSYGWSTWNSGGTITYTSETSNNIKTERYYQEYSGLWYDLKKITDLSDNSVSYDYKCKLYNGNDNWCLLCAIGMPKLYVNSQLENMYKTSIDTTNLIEYSGMFYREDGYIYSSSATETQLYKSVYQKYPDNYCLYSADITSLYVNTFSGTFTMTKDVDYSVADTVVNGIHQYTITFDKSTNASVKTNERINYLRMYNNDWFVTMRQYSNVEVRATGDVEYAKYNYSLKIGNTTLTETQLQQLLALIQ